MKLKLLLLFLVVVGFVGWGNAQTKRPYNNLIITEARFNNTPQNYVEFTNMGNETIDLSQFGFGHIQHWNQPFVADANQHLRLPSKMLAPGKSFLIAVGSDFEVENWKTDPLHNMERVTKPEFYKIADMILHRQENKTNAKDSITPNWNTMDCWNGRDCWFLKHYFINDAGIPDSAVIDQVGGIFDEADGTNQDKASNVAGVTNATNNSTLMRRNSITTGVTDFTSTAANIAAAKVQFVNNSGLDLSDSEWIPVPNYPSGEEWRAVWWTAGNQVDAKIEAGTLVSKTGKVKVDLANLTITVPWGVRRLDSLMYQFNRTPGLAWAYDYAPTVEDSAYNTCRTGDKLTVYAIGNVATIKAFRVIVEAPTASDNIVIQKNGYDYTRKMYGKWVGSYSGYRITDGVPVMDSINHIDFATRVDTLFKYLEKAPKATWKIVYSDGVVKPDLKNGDKLRVTSENGSVKDYFLKLDKFVSSDNDYLASITWPDIPSSFKGDVAGSYGWKSDTIPGFSPSSNNYVVMVPIEYQGIPALIFQKQQTDSKVVVTRAKTLEGTAADRTVTFTVTAEDDSTVNVYTVRFEKQKDMDNVPYIGEPFFSQYVFKEQWSNCYLEIANPGNQPMDLSNYMIAMGWGEPETVLLYSSTNNIASNGTSDWQKAYARYVPGRKWVDEATWAATPSMLEPDMAVNSIVYPGEVFVIADVRTFGGNDKTHGNGDTQVRSQIDIDFFRNPWGRPNIPDLTAIRGYNDETIYMWKITNDSVKNGLKPATDPMDFKLIESFGTGSASTGCKIGGVTEDQIQSTFRKPEIYKPNPVIGGSNGTTLEDSEWYFTNYAYYVGLNYGWPDNIIRVVDGIGSHNMTEVTIQKSTVTSKLYKVSKGLSNEETIRGIITGTTVSGFYDAIVKADPAQALKVTSKVDGIKLLDDAALANGDTLVVISKDSTNTTRYILDVTVSGLNHDAVLTSAPYTIDVATTTGTISGFDKNTLLKTVFDGVTVPAGATLTITDQNDAYMSLVKLNYDSVYVNVIATDQIYFEVIAEDGTTKIVYQLKPTVNPSDAYVTSDLYSVDQLASVIQFVPVGTSLHSLLANLYPATGATMAVYDKGGFERTSGDIYRDDKIIVTSADGTVTKAYYFIIFDIIHVPMAYVISDVYQINQIYLIINVASLPTSISDFKANLYPSFGANLKVIDANGNESALTNLVLGDKLLVTSSDGNLSATYSIQAPYGISADQGAISSIKMYPNPTDGKVIVQGLAKGNRVQVFNAAGIALRDVIAENSTDIFSLESQPAGIYIFVISSGNQHLTIQKIIKK